MLKFNKKAFMKNKTPILIISGIVIIFFILSIFIFNETNGYPSKDLEDEIDSNIHKLVINEFMSSNGGVHTDKEGKLYDWVELYNGNDHEINLNNYGLSDKANEVKWVFPDVTIEAKSYLIIYLSGEKREGLYASFSLKTGGGETLSLRNRNGKVIDAIDTSRVEKNHSMARDSEGKWFITDKPTPGFENSLKGYEEYIKSLTIDNPGLEITEILPKNSGNFIIDGNLTGFIEITNTSENDINVENYSVSDNLSVPFKWQLPKKVLKPNEILVIYTSGLNKKDDILHASFKLNTKNGNAVLTNNKGNIIDNVEYKNLANGRSYTKASGNFFESNDTSPGYPNTADGIKDFNSKFHSNKEDLIINEVMNSNTKYIPQNGGQYYDLVELKNNSNKTIKLSDYHLSNTDNNINFYRLPEVELKSGEYIVLIASGYEKYSNSEYHHTNFKVSNNDGLYLSKNNTIIDSVFVGEIPANNSYGRDNNNGFYYIETPTPGGANNQGTVSISYMPKVTTPAGVFNDIESLKVEFVAAGDVYYTVDGSTPSYYSNKYTGPLTINKTVVLKTISYEEGKKPSKVSTNSYIVNENHTLPVISVSVNENDFDDINYNAWEEGYQVPSYAEFFEKDGSFSIPCGLKLFGGSTRGHDKKSYALKFKKVYGESYLNYQVFPNVTSHRYDTLVLRSGSQDYPFSMIRDELATSLVNGLTKVEVQEYKATILYINGEYWGVYFLREKVDEDFISNHYNVSGDNTDIIRIDGSVTVGSDKDYNAMLNYVSTNNMSESKHYDYIKTILNVESVIDFWIGELYTTNNDIVNQRYFRNPNVDNGRWNMIFYDFDFSFYNFRHNYFDFLTNPNGSSDMNFDNRLIRNLLKNNEFKNLFLERLSYNLKNVWTDDRINKRIDELTNLIKPEMNRNQERWDLTMKDWEDGLGELKNFVNERRPYFLNQIKSFFSLNDKQMKEYFG